MLEIGERREIGDGVEFLEELTDDLVGVGPLAETFDLREGPHQRVLGLTNGDVGVVLPLPLQTLLMFDDFASKEVSETLTR
jgi:hypothetical protein